MDMGLGDIGLQREGEQDQAGQQPPGLPDSTPCCGSFHVYPQSSLTAPYSNSAGAALPPGFPGISGLEPGRG
jgi:hypothetical protein